MFGDEYTAFSLIALAMIFLIAELFLPTSGVLAAGGIIAFAIGALLLVGTDVQIYGVSWPLILAFAVVGIVLALLSAHLVVKARRRPVVSGQEQLLGASGDVLADFSGEGWATVLGETWRVRSAVPLTRGQQVRVTNVDGLTLDVEPRSTQPTPSKP